MKCWVPFPYASSHIQTPLDPSPLLPVSNSLEPSYNPVPEGTVSAGCPATRLRRSKKVLIAVFSGLLVVSLILATINNNSGAQHGDENASLAASRETAKPETLLPAGSRGVSAGVSEKANFKGAGVKDYPWNNSMLSWQRTAFHFQPEDNWMNGMVRTSR
ncbi:hypothetical protein OIU78_013911 [Salix suchowensis]|nr:hypothetical protein OIU78_013911 [Salix suchowensis]